MKRICLFLTLLLMVLFVKPCFAVSYGDLYDIEWCPCDPEEQFNAQGSVVLGKTVMCPCDSMYKGYGRTLKNDIQKVKEVSQKVMQKASNYKYYIGIDFNKATFETKKDEIVFDEVQFNTPITIGANEIFDDQDNIGFVIGTRPHPNLGIEAFYNRTLKDNKVVHAGVKAIGATQYHVVNNYTTKYQAFGVDIVGYMPVTDFLDIVAFAGLGQYYFDNEVKHEIADTAGGSGSGVPYIDSFSSDFSDDTLAWRVGGGIQLNIGRGVVVRGVYRYIDINSAYIKNIEEFSVGLRLVF